MNKNEGSWIENEWNWKKDVYSDVNFLIKSIETNNKENFYPDFCRNDKELNKELQEHRVRRMEALYDKLINIWIKNVMIYADEKSEYYKDAIFLTKYIDRLFDNFKSEKNLVEIFETEEIKQKFYKLLDKYLYKGYATIRLEIVKNAPSKKIIEDAKILKKQEKEKERKWLELERQRKEADEKSTARAENLANYLIEEFDLKPNNSFDESKLNTKETITPEELDAWVKDFTWKRETGIGKTKRRGKNK